MIGNPQTDRLLENLGLDHRITVPFAGAMQQQPTLFSRQQPPPPPPQQQQLIPSSVIHGRTGHNPSHNVDDENEIDLDEDDAEGGSGVIVENKQDPDEIDLDECEDEDGEEEGGDDVCFSPPSTVAKRPRTES